jgi:nitrite reductase/ring-hydroxylating ferredoxin subunit
MESEITYCETGKDHLSGHIRRSGIDPNCWYMIAKSSEVGEQPVKREIWNESVVLFRTANEEIHALEDRCAHRLVKLSFGRVVEDKIECVYHGWQFNGARLEGIAAASLLAERGFRVTLFDRNRYLGGKVGSWDVSLGNGFATKVDHGFHAFSDTIIIYARLWKRSARPVASEPSMITWSSPKTEKLLASRMSRPLR